MVHVILSHEVKDAAEWKSHFEADAANRAEAGIKVNGVYAANDNPNHITVITEFPSHEVLNAPLSIVQI